MRLAVVGILEERRRVTGVTSLRCRWRTAAAAGTGANRLTNDLCAESARALCPALPPERAPLL